MNKIIQRFGRLAVLPVVHAVTRSQTKDAVKLALELGADGVFLISHGGLNRDDLFQEGMYALEVAETVRRRDEGTLRTRTVPALVGFNFLGMPPTRGLAWVRDTEIGGLWTDNAGGARGIEDFEAARTAGGVTSWRGLHFGGVAFKYQPDETPPAVAAREAVDAGLDVVTTSGPGTGQAPDVMKVFNMRSAIGDHALAIASGVTPDNVLTYAPFADAFLVATGIEQSDGVFDPALLGALVERVHGWHKGTFHWQKHGRGQVAVTVTRDGTTKKALHARDDDERARFSSDLRTDGWLPLEAT